ncbi:hypothetical protein ON010_g18476 [Phytophthora cinnamomi]|nr:hypothetical protein ON010_g18476 [Phytophthora cinnamomi]
METRNACKTFKAACSAIMNCGAVWPNYTLVTSSLKAVELPPTKLNIRYGVSRNIYQSDTTGDPVSVESREISYFRMTEDCGYEGYALHYWSGAGATGDLHGRCGAHSLPQHLHEGAHGGFSGGDTSPGAVFEVKTTVRTDLRLVVVREHQNCFCSELNWTLPAAMRTIIYARPQFANNMGRELFTSVAMNRGLRPGSPNHQSSVLAVPEPKSTPSEEKPTSRAAARGSFLARSVDQTLSRCAIEERC